ncbi:MAG: translesion error-prone DNA polymerase V autoproteolytic subunit [Bacteroidales bacterium]|nr:translesion error-prone DNA polymerase V autoproteolytic subunit [Bacteroidales bacterium]
MDKMTPYEIDPQSSGDGVLMGNVRAGFPSPSDDVREKLDLAKLLVRHPASTFFFRISGVSMVDAAMDEGDIVIVDRSLEPYNNCKAVCYIDGEYTLKRVEISSDRVRLMPANETDTRYKPIDVHQESNFMIWGVVTYIIKQA